ncbi:MAG: pimeloyl-ACP methyl ester carboxylesterase [Glaciecola sp.]|jgi:pimeloyl-ACP methyl ester carboxylesterase
MISRTFISRVIFTSIIAASSASLLNQQALASDAVLNAVSTNLTVTYPNERPVVFENDGVKVDAFEGSIQVLENRSDENSRLIPVHYLRFPSTSKKPGSPVVYLAGGPGGSGISTVSYSGFRFPLFMAMREFGDVIALDQRGTGKSRTAPKCESKQGLPLNEILSDATITSSYRAAALECLEFWKQQGVDVMGYTTIQNAKDIDQLREHLNAEKVTLWGISYGSHLAFTSMKLMPGKIDKVVIASAEGLNQTVKMPARTDAYFARLQLAINLQPKAAAAYPDIKMLMRRVHKMLDENPIKLQIPVKDGDAVEFLFQRVHMQILASAMIADPHRAVPMLLEVYSGIDQGETQMLPALVQRVGFDKTNISFDVMSFTMDVASGITADKLKQFNEQAESSLVGKSLNFPMPQLNQVIDGLDLGDEFREYPKSDIPTLLLTGTLDGRTYIESQREATQGLSNLTHVVVKNAGHNLFMVSPDVTALIQQFMNNEVIKTTEIEFKLPPFVK